MTIDLQPARNPVATWDTFVKEIGEAVVARAYRVTTFPRVGEDVWDVLVDDCLAGWGSLIASPLDKHPLLCVGILPRYQRLGIRRTVKAQLALKARVDGQFGVKTAVLLSNPEHLARVMCESVKSEFKFAGIVTLPAPGYAQFCYTFEE